MPPRPAGATAAASVVAGLATVSGAPHITFNPIQGSFEASASRPTGGVSATMISEALLDARLQSVESKLEVKFTDRFAVISAQIAEIIVKIEQDKSGIAGKLTDLKTSVDSKAGALTVWGAAFTVIASGIGLIALSASQFGSGFSAASAYAAENAKTAASLEANTAQLEALQRKAISDAKSEKRDPSKRP